ncbi:MAG: hypothetical protein KatS3mg038_2317 [Candidatus Kapaibacterium sp.]|nr:MAG: hypothetical protein KatS3mg038_2317 [Candidatus Kapabacteria bacterium]
MRPAPVSEHLYPYLSSKLEHPAPGPSERSCARHSRPALSIQGHYEAAILARWRRSRRRPGRRVRSAGGGRAWVPSTNGPTDRRPSRGTNAAAFFLRPQAL